MIKAFAFDVDGVLTDGGILCDLEGNLFRTFDAKDGFAIRMAVMNGYPVACITGGSSISITKRLLTSGMTEDNIYLHARDKSACMRDFCSRHGLDPSEVMYFGDDIPDIETMQMCGRSVAPSDAVQEVKEAATDVSPFPGGRGCVRDSIEKEMKVQGRWLYDTSAYKKLF